MNRAESVWDVVSDGELHTLSDISQKTGYPEPSVSAQLREFRWPKWGFIVEKKKVLRRDGHIIYAYKISGKNSEQPPMKIDKLVLLKKCRSYLKSFRKLDDEGQSLLFELNTVLLKK